MKIKRTINIIIIVLGFSLIVNYFIYDNVKKTVNNVDANNYISKPVVKNNMKDDIIGVLNIPKINFKMGFYNYNSKENNVNKNITLLNNTLPDKKNSTMIIAAHSGNSYLGYFKNLDKLDINDNIEIYYNNKKYHYIVDNIYEEEKDGTIEINKNSKDTTLILTTCSKKKDKQLIIFCKLFRID